MNRYNLVLLALVVLGFLTAVAIVLIGDATPSPRPVPAAERFGEGYVAPEGDGATPAADAPSAGPVRADVQVTPAGSTRPPPTTSPVRYSPRLIAAASPVAASSARVLAASSARRVVVTCLDIQASHVAPGYCKRSRVR